MRRLMIAVSILILAALVILTVWEFRANPVTITLLNVKAGLGTYRVTNNASVPMTYFAASADRPCWMSQKYEAGEWKKGVSGGWDNTYICEIAPKASLDMKISTFEASQGSARWKLGLDYFIGSYPESKSDSFFVKLFIMFKRSFVHRVAWTSELGS